MQRSRGSKWTKMSILVMIAMLMIVGVYYSLSRKPVKSSEEVVASTAVTDVLSRNLDKNYPPTPKEVVKFFSAITQCFYNESYTDEELEALAVQIRRLYDRELAENQTDEQYMRTLRSDIENYKKNNRVISSYSLPASTDVELFHEEGYECARLYCMYTIREGTRLGTLNEVFILRKDETGHWKIFGWREADD